MGAKKGELTTTQIFYIVAFLIAVVVFIAIALWGKGYGLNVIDMIAGMVPGTVFFRGSKSRKGLSITMNAIWFLLAVIFIVLVLAVSNGLFSWVYAG